MTNTSRAKGNKAEILVHRLFVRLGFPKAKRTRAGRREDEGDIIVSDGEIIVQVKDSVSTSYGVWLAATETQRQCNGAEFGILVHKRRGVADPAHWLAIMTVADMARLLTRAGYGTGQDVGHDRTDPPETAA